MSNGSGTHLSNQSLVGEGTINVRCVQVGDTQLQSAVDDSYSILFLARGP